MKITADFNKITGTIKPMHGVGQPPLLAHRATYFHYLSDAGIPYSRLHDVGGVFGGNRFVDIPNIFRDFNADVNDPASYDFAFTDFLISALIQHNCEPIFRLGVTIENGHLIKAYRIFPPADYQKWAEICEHIIMHYNYGWANGFNYNITYWEIWNEPDDCFSEQDSAMWKGTPEQYYRLYEVAANHLKKRFGDEIKVGGYASCGFFACDKDPDGTGLCAPAATLEEFYIEFFHGFLKYITSSEHLSPIDFFSWHLYGPPKDIIKYSRYCRKVLKNYNLSHIPDMLNEWNSWHSDIQRGTPYAAANALSTMLGMQKEQTELLAFYDARIGASKYSGLFSPETYKPYLAYNVFLAFNELYRLGNEIESISDNPDIYVGGAKNGEKAVLLVSNTLDRPVVLDMDIMGVDLATANVKLIDGEHFYTADNTALTDKKLTLAAYGSAQIEF